ncbi:LysR substrate-binding domain-containing protein [Rhodocyclus tenuis]|uniref:DNA-binding transcriptional LysR family regulator n=1 Tax=Rhodocyclus tenuis TaxID=1066 RepID=A0A840G5R3_RHOTE|nr:LysR substrate-binding domain-containing protein [Rhodocyclus tenuis]MBB4247713.1 DNA-binding transcriptional LysR family regulator [Rhodocyclus tenuis]
MNITLRQLAVFVGIARQGQVTRAAQALAMSQAAASMALADMENQLGAALFNRLGRRLSLTDTGREILPLAQEVLDRSREIEEVAQAKGAAFDIHLGASVTIGNHLLPALLAELSRTQPLGKVHLARFNTEQVLKRLLAFEIDLGFIEGPASDPQLQFFPWLSDELVVFASPEHPLVCGGATPEALQSVSWVTREAGSGTRETFDRAFGEIGITPRIALELEQPEAVRQCVRLGMGLGCLSALELKDAFAAGWLAPVPTPFLDLSRELRVVVHRQKHHTRGIRAILALCHIAAADLPATAQARAADRFAGSFAKPD